MYTEVASNRSPMPLTRCVQPPDVIVAQQAEDPIEEANGVDSLPCTAPRRVAANVGALDFGQDSVQMLVGWIGQARKVMVFQGEEVVGEAGKVGGIDERPPMARTGWSFGRGGFPSAPRSPASSTKQMCNDVPKKAMATGWWP